MGELFSAACEAARESGSRSFIFSGRLFLHALVFFFRARRCARLPLQPLPSGAAADAWNFGLCATKSREPRQARKGATVPGSLRAPRSTRSSSHLNRMRNASRAMDGQPPWPSDFLSVL